MILKRWRDVSNIDNHPPTYQQCRALAGYKAPVWSDLGLLSTAPDHKAPSGVSTLHIHRQRYPSSFKIFTVFYSLFFLLHHAWRLGVSGCVSPNWCAQMLGLGNEREHLMLWLCVGENRRVVVVVAGGG